MKTYLSLTAILCVILIFFPLAAVTVKNQTSLISDSSFEPAKDITESENNSSISVLQVSSGKVMEMELFDYVIGAVAGEMPASFHEEALKAQAVASYTYAIWVKNNADNSSEGLKYDITDSPGQHQSYLSEEQLKEKWGDKYDYYMEKIKNAVFSVMGQCIMCSGEPVLAVFHAISPGMTESAKTVWGNDLPYLQSVTAPGDTLSPDFDSEGVFTPSEITEALSITKDARDEKLIEDISAESSGFVREIKVADKTFTGLEFAQRLSLKSPYFTAEYKDGKYTFSVKGYGHGLGMSQYSADYMARQGSTYDEILAHFYKGTYITEVL